MGLLANKFRDSTADKLKDGDITDAKIQDFIVRDMKEIRTKLDALSRKELKNSYLDLKAGVDFLDASDQVLKWSCFKSFKCMVFSCEISRFFAQFYTPTTPKPFPQNVFAYTRGYKYILNRNFLRHYPRLFHF